MCICARRRKWFVEVQEDVAGRRSIPLEIKVCTMHVAALQLSYVSAFAVIVVCTVL